MCRDRQKKYPFFWGVYTGAIGRPPQLLNGSIRTASNLGLNGEAAQNEVVFQNQVTRQAVRHGFNYLFWQQPDPMSLIPIWQHLPKPAQDNIVDWGYGKTGEVVGGGIVSSAISKQLTKAIPKRVLFPIMFTFSCQGAMAALWHRDDGPPPPPTGGGGSGIMT